MSFSGVVHYYNLPADAATVTGVLLYAITAIPMKILIFAAIMKTKRDSMAEASPTRAN